MVQPAGVVGAVEGGPQGAAEAAAGDVASRAATGVCNGREGGGDKRLEHFSSWEVLRQRACNPLLYLVFS